MIQDYAEKAPFVKSSKPDMKVINGFRKRLKSSRATCSAYHKRADINNNFISALGQQWAADDIQKMKDMNAPALTLRYIHLIINALSGRETVDRIEPVVMPFGPGDDAEVWNYFIKWDRGNYASRVESEAFRSALVGGLGIVRTRTDHNLWIPKTKWSAPEVYDYFWDTTAREVNFKDRTWQCLAMKMSEDKFASVYPQHKKDIPKLKSMASLSGGFMKFGDMQEARFRPKVYDKSTGGAINKAKEDAIEVILYERVVPSEKILVDYGDYYDIIGKKRFASEFMGPDGSFLVERWKPIDHLEIQWYLISGNKILERGRAPDWTIHPITGFKHITKKDVKYFGYVDLGKDAQRMLNKFYSLWIYGLATNPKNTFFAKTSAFDNVQVAENRLAKGGLIPVSEDIDFNDILYPVQRADMPDFASGFQSMRQVMMDMSGIDPYSLGSVGDTGSLSRTSAKAISQVAGAGAQLAAQPLDSYALYKEEVTRTQMRYAYEFLNEEDLSRISLGINSPRQVQIPPKQTWRAAFDRDIVIDHRPASPTEKQAFWESLTQMPELLGFILQNFPDLVVEVMPPAVPESFKRLLSQRLQMMQEQEAGAAEEEGEVTQEAENV